MNLRDQLRSEKGSIEESITELLQHFEKQTGCLIQEIKIFRDAKMNDSDFKCDKYPVSRVSLMTVLQE